MNLGKEVFNEIEDVRRLFELICEESRFKILITLFASETPLSFNQLQQLTGLNPGTLSKHLEKLINAKIIEKYKTSNNPKQLRSFYKLTDKGVEILRKIGLDRYEQELKELFKTLTMKELKT